MAPGSVRHPYMVSTGATPVNAFRHPGVVANTTPCADRIDSAKGEIYIGTGDDLEVREPLDHFLQSARGGSPRRVSAD
jgi:hypothetical protein